jgi:Na+-translocating ferredoxin:NAD+ oxidoreductase RNF subunit RnfB
MSLFQQPVKVRIEETLCIACGLCREACPERAVHPKMQDIHHMYEVLENQCTGCGDCLPYCPVPGALEKYEPKRLES